MQAEQVQSTVAMMDTGAVAQLRPDAASQPALHGYHTRCSQHPVPELCRRRLHSVQTLSKRGDSTNNPAVRASSLGPVQERSPCPLMALARWIDCSVSVSLPWVTDPRDGPSAGRQGVWAHGIRHEGEEARGISVRARTAQVAAIL